MKNDMYWNVGEVLSYQRNFNFINSLRKVGKTYTLEEFFIKQALKKGLQFVYICRTQKEKQNYIMRESFEKVLDVEYPGIEFECNKDSMYYINDNDQKVQIGHCLALSEAEEVKKRTFPYVKYMMFDEYTLPAYSNKYVHGWEEPDSLLSIYHTVDADTDRVILFCLGNNYTFYNPYHLHPAFNIPWIPVGDIWCSDNVLFQRPVRTQALEEKQSQSKFRQMIAGTEYGDHATNGEYIDDKPEFIGKKTGNCRYIFTFLYNNQKFGVWSGINQGKVYIDKDIEPTCYLVYALTVDDHKENTMLTKSKHYAPLKWLSDNFKRGNVRFANMEVKTRAEGALRLIL